MFVCLGVQFADGGHCKENDQKRIRALKKASRERDLKNQRIKELAKTKQGMVVLKKGHQSLYNKVQQYSIFNNYLEKVVEVSEVSLDASVRDQGIDGLA